MAVEIKPLGKNYTKLTVKMSPGVKDFYLAKGDQLNISLEEHPGEQVILRIVKDGEVELSYVRKIGE